MPVNPELVGRSFPPTPPYLVGREKVREFAAAVFATDPVSFDVAAAQAAGHADLVAPPTFAVVVQQLTLDQLLADPEAGIDFSRVVHGDQRFTFSRPIVAGDELTATLTVTSVKSLGTHSMVTAESVIVDDAGEHVVTTVSTLVVRGDE
ncbi:MaoC family dehydratase N-terminal domain-containing protein [Leifsonia sp. TF02-11]|uniref:FAS1-like dehydratase domain-containing protein n=1 Tax=Leifsonia sp. TF02-11 TaxID=2815212 RepID=UPI001AA14F5F|nr:MaoC family dehydratase N-terminal domain-containing protein [Leifsonia sp. TF02-11]MBO1740108.1 MaoC family dehydratase N-terminal domain-containing protein [Leifsonia sp. TF02-11]